MDFLECTADVLPVAFNVVFTLFKLKSFYWQLLELGLLSVALVFQLGVLFFSNVCY